METYYGPTGVAVDATGNIYYTHRWSNNTVTKIDPQGRESVLPFKWLETPFAVTVDAAGNVYVSNYEYDSRLGYCPVYRLSVKGVQTRIAIPELRRPTDLHVDSAGNLYVVDSWSGRIVRVLPDGTQETIPPGNLDFPFGIFVDTAGTITVSNIEDRVGIVRRDAAGNDTTLPFTNLDRSTGLDIDSAGNIYVAQLGVRNGIPRVLKMTPDGTQSVLPFGPGVLRRPMGIAVTDTEILVADDYGLQRLAL